MSSSTSRSHRTSSGPGKLVLLVGLGSLGASVLDLLLRLPGKHRFLAGSREPDRIRKRVNLALFMANQLGRYPDVDCVAVDLADVDRTSELLSRLRPDVVFCAATHLPWGAIRQLSPETAEELWAAQIGPWLPMHLPLVRKLMLAVRQAAIPAHVVNAAYPDVVHPVLVRAGLAPATGIGDLANNVPALRHAAAAALGMTAADVDVRLVAQHHVSYWMSRLGHTDGAPFHLSVSAAGRDVTPELDVASLLRSLSNTYMRASGNLMTAMSAAVVIDGMINDRGIISHAPGPNGLPGGYPVEVSGDGVYPVVPHPLTVEAAVEINTRARRWDGVERIDDDGTVHFAAEQMAIMRRVLGYECRSLRLDDMDAAASELLARFRQRVALG